MQKIADNLYTFTGLLAGRVYCIDDGPSGLTIVDAGLKSAAGKIITQLKKAGFNPAAVKRILVTHAHLDHIGGLPDLKAATGAEVIAHDLDRPIIEGKEGAPRAGGKSSPPPDRGTPVDRVVSDGEALPKVMGKMVVYHTPGHSYGHLSFFQPERKILFCGDVFMHFMGRLSLPFAAYTPDMEENKTSAQKLAMLYPATVCFGHGPVLTQNAALKLRTFVNRWTD
nr:MBL fold metallo-hydrolase [Anaerolineae bacterium]